MIIYASRTGNVESIIGKLNLPSMDIEKVDKVESKYILFTYTDGLGMIPPVVDEFLRNHHSLCVGVIASGNKNFGHQFYCGSATKINERYDIPILKTLELRGSPEIIEDIKKQYNEIFELD